MTHKTKATWGGRQWENTKHKPEHHSDLLAGGNAISLVQFVAIPAMSAFPCTL
ncbi:hypothetical protein GKK33_06455 [Shigella sonnei]|nr:hypothetical protein [Shigella sonnei]